jgi:small-conductance mechanosensitive channel
LLFSLAIAGIILYFANRWLLRGKKLLSQESRLTRQGIIIVLSVLAVIFVLLNIPMPTETRGQLLSLLGIVLTGVIAFSSSSFISNIMGGLMLRFIRSFRAGDFLSVNDQFGRVTEIGLMHTEIQTEDRDLITFPNLYLITNPVKVVRASGTIISATLSLGYENAHNHIETLLKKAAIKSGLEEPYVRVVDLGDFSVNYRIAGILKEVKLLLTARSNLRRQVLDSLHEAGIEIVSPNFMNQRPLKDGQLIIPKKVQKETPSKKEDHPEDIIFDKAEEAESKDNLKKKYEEINALIQEKKKALKAAPAEQKTQIETEVTKLTKQLDILETQIEAAAEKEKGE